MNKIILTGASILALTAASPAFAQLVLPPATPTAPTVPSPDCDGIVGNCSVLDQDGTGLDADIDQDGTGNVSDVDQDGDDIIAVVSQGADNNISNVTQSNPGAGALGPDANVTQSGGAESVVSQTAGGLNGNVLSVIVDQAGASDSEVIQSTVSENAGDFLATVNQTGDGNTSLVTQTDDGAGSTNDQNFTAFVTQNGSDNASELIQINRQQDATIEQSGDRNEAIVDQSGRQNFVNLDQSGDDGDATILQEGRRQSSTVDQRGSNNAITIFQDDTGSVGQTATVDQRGTGNVGDIFQDGRNPGPDDGKNFATLTQRGDNGLANIEQVDQARGDSATINQREGTSFANAFILQTGDDDGGGADTLNVADINQVSGIGNEANILQGDATIITGGTVTSVTNALAEIRQEGDNNEIIVAQTGDGQIADVRQNGNNLASFVNQGLVGGGNNEADVRQTGEGGFGVSDVLQDSSRNFAFVRQDGGPDNLSFIDQGFVGGAGTGGDDNSAEVRQDGSGNSSFIEQNNLTAGTFNTVDVRQTGDDNLSIIAQEGSTNDADVRQFDGATSIVDQIGNNLMATVRQGS